MSLTLPVQVSIPTSALRSTATAWPLEELQSGSLPGGCLKMPSTYQRRNISKKHCPVLRKSGCSTGKDQRSGHKLSISPSTRNSFQRNDCRVPDYLVLSWCCQWFLLNILLIWFLLKITHVERIIWYYFLAVEPLI